MSENTTVNLVPVAKIGSMEILQDPIFPNSTGVIVLIEGKPVGGIESISLSVGLDGIKKTMVVNRLPVEWFPAHETEIAIVRLRKEGWDVRIVEVKA